MLDIKFRLPLKLVNIRNIHLVANREYSAQSTIVEGEGEDEIVPC